MSNLWVIIFGFDYIECELPIVVRNLILNFVFALKINHKNKSIRYYLL